MQLNVATERTSLKWQVGNIIINIGAVGARVRGGGGGGVGTVESDK